MSRTAQRFFNIATTAAPALENAADESLPIIARDPTDDIDANMEQYNRLYVGLEAIQNTLDAKSTISTQDAQDYHARVVQLFDGIDATFGADPAPSLEDFAESAKKVWQFICDLMEKAWEFLKKLALRIYQAVAGLKKRAEILAGMTHERGGAPRSATIELASAADRLAMTRHSNGFVMHPDAIIRQILQVHSEMIRFSEAAAARSYWMLNYLLEIMTRKNDHTVNFGELVHSCLGTGMKLPPSFKKIDSPDDVLAYGMILPGNRAVVMQFPIFQGEDFKSGPGGGIYEFVQKWKAYIFINDHGAPELTAEQRQMKTLSLRLIGEIGTACGKMLNNADFVEDNAGVFREGYTTAKHLAPILAANPKLRVIVPGVDSDNEVEISKDAYVAGIRALALATYKSYQPVVLMNMELVRICKAMIEVGEQSAREYGSSDATNAGDQRMLVDEHAD